MYEANQAAGGLGNMLAKQTGIGGQAAGMMQAGAPRPIGSIASQVAAMHDLVDRLEGQRNRLYSSMERLIMPRPTDKVQGNLGAGGIQNIPVSTVESQLQTLINRAQQLLSSMNELADTLDSAV